MPLQTAIAREVTANIDLPFSSMCVSVEATGQPWVQSLSSALFEIFFSAMYASVYVCMHVFMHAVSSWPLSWLLSVSFLPCLGCNEVTDC